MRRLSVMGAGALVLALAVGASGAASAGSAKAGSGCPEDTLCLWSKKDYKGDKVEITKVGEVSNKLAEKLNNEASSVKNKFDRDATLYAKRDGAGDQSGICPLESIPNLGDFSNRASSSLVFAPVSAKRICKRSGAPSDKGAGKKCAAGALCVWTGKNYKGTKYKVTEPGNIVKLPAKVNNKVSSAKNRWENVGILYETKNAGGQSFCVEPGEEAPDFSAFIEEFNNEASSAFLHESGQVCGP
jgi:hypothetical protein